ncbi:hypothetical protein DESUT3_14990 [Desulfuromonas versatilis]|uniref:Dystroglycan-type cadherin-like domain-containing protein n=1 Tax=Desulfuromonas versatilis TaxID=2802975 RepID=A0ABN6DWB2_9BACT|nr:hypothetical protein DESUT3_14990 [Desulfuromonas versatilis]
MRAILEDFSSDPNVVSAEADYPVRAFLTPNDPSLASQWGMTSIAAGQAWNFVTGNPELVVGVVDSGIDYRHEDLSGKVVSGYDFVNGDGDALDDVGHGTHIAGVIGAQTNNGKGVAGLNWQVSFLPVKVLGANQMGSTSALTQGIYYAVNNGAKVINLSVGSLANPSYLLAAVNFAHSKGCLLVAAIGNGGGNILEYPAAYPKVLAVGATDRNDVRVANSTWGSNFGSHIDLVAPGQGILSTIPGNRYQAWDGTSMAAPHVAGVAALVWSANPSLTNDQVADILIKTADDQVGNPTEDVPGWDPYYGWGRLNALRAVEMALQAGGGPAEPANSPPRFTSAPVTAATQGQGYSYSVAVTDPDAGQTLTIAGTYPSWLTLADRGNGTATLAGTPGNAQVGSHPISLKVTDAGGLSATQNFSIAVANVNDPPSFVSTPVISARQGTAYRYALRAADVDAGDKLTISGTYPAWLALTDNGDGTATLGGTPGNAQVGNHSINLKVTDAGGLSATQAFIITVANLNDPPTFSSSPVLSAQQGTAYSYAVKGADVDTGDSLTITGTYPAWLTLTDHGNGSATLSGTPDNGQVGNHPVGLKVTDGGGLSATQNFSILVSNLNDAPVFTSTPVTSAEQGKAYTYTVKASDPDAGDKLTFSGSYPSWLTLTDNGDGTAILAGAAGVEAVGEHSVSLTVDDPGGLAASQSFTLSVTAAPVQLAILACPPAGEGAACVVREDGGDASSNLDVSNGKPRIDIRFRFQVLLSDPSGAPPPQIVLVLNGYVYPMNLLSGDAGHGATYAYTTWLGPAPVCNYHFEARDDAGTLIFRYPTAGELAGPAVRLVRGANLVGLPGALEGANLAAAQALGTANAYRWDSEGLSSTGNRGAFVLVDSSGPVRSGEGYLVQQAEVGTTLPPVDGVPEITASEFALALKPGWNIISIPYGGPVRLADIKVQRGGAPPVSWAEAISERWLPNVFYYLKGSDYGNNYGYLATYQGPDVALVPWLGYWLYLSRSDADYRLIISRPGL